MSTIQKQYEFLLQEFLDLPATGLGTGDDRRYRVPPMETALMGDEACERADDFQKAFPSHRPDPNHTNAASRIRRRLNEMVVGGFATKHIIGTHKDSIGESGGWNHVYYLKDDLFNDLKHGRRNIGDVAAEMYVSKQTNPPLRRVRGFGR